MSRPAEPSVVTHARQALARAKSGVAAVRARLRATDVRSLDSGLADLADSFASLEAATESQLPQRWSQFFACYDRVLASLRTFESPADEND